MRQLASLVGIALVTTLTLAAQRGQPSAVQMPNQNGSLKFAVLGGFGMGDDAQDQVARQMIDVRSHFPFDLLLLTGGNIYGEQRPQDYERKFQRPYRPLLDAGVIVRATLGQDDDLN